MERFSNINTILAFVTVAREGSVSKAAEVLNLTQPAISHQIKRLTEETGITLFDRTPGGLRITPDGKALLGKAEQVLEVMTEFHRSAHRRAGRVRGKLRIGTIVDPEFIRLGRLLSNLRVEYPEIETELVHGMSGNILARLRRNQIDAGFFLSGPDDVDQFSSDQDEPIHAVKLADFSYKVIAPDGWQDRITGADWTQLAALPWIGTPELSVHHRLLGKIFEEHGCQQNVVALVDQESSMLEMVRAGVGLSLSRDSIALQQKQSFGLAVCDDVSIPASLSFITLERLKGNPAVSALFELLRKTWRRADREL
ncbi:LysR family transcriptional regulator [Actibacterium pelagium]|uniref:LysR family transcriptional regulator n=1 Tax=Actibacterium pelagium TaxID=2029103 RepID=A0A917AF86_9RHOB|nr:LysR family transcriptional regulator [Actibacterium pelagium]GGE48471.1 LysR family transcriptional regulator [Actibacterium pelagium]